MRLPGIRWITASKSSLQDGARGGTAAAGDGSVYDFDSWILLFIYLEQSVESGRLASGRPPGKDFQLLGVIRKGGERY
jgi:hypothetical protein